MVPSVGKTFILPVVMKLPVESYVTPGTVMKSKLWGTIQMKRPILIVELIALSDVWFELL